MSYSFFFSIRLKAYYRPNVSWLLARISILLVSTHAVWGQTSPLIDELYQRLPPTLSDTARVNLYQKLSHAYESRNMDSAALYAARAYALARKTGNPISIATSLGRRAQVLFQQAQLDSAIALALRAKALLDSADATPSRIAHNLTYLGDYYQRKAQYADALSYYQRAIALQREMADSSGLVLALSNLGMLRAQTREYPKAVDLTREAYEIAQALQDTSLLMEAATNRGAVYVYDRREPLALVYAKEGLGWAEQTGDLRKQAYNLNNIAQAYQHQGAYQEALPYYCKALTVKDTLNDEDAMARTYFGMGGCYKKLGQYEQSRRHYNQGLALAQKNDFIYGEMLFHYSLSDLDSITGNMTDALGHMYRYIEIKDSILSLEKTKEIEELEARYEAEARDREIELLQRENALKISETQRQSNLKNAFVAGVLLLIALLGVLYSRYCLKRKTLRITAAQKREIEQRNERIEIKNRENEILLREIHHRVKNNLQIILSLLNIQSRKFDDQAVLEFIQEGQNRIRSMALIHQDLYQADRLDKIVFNEYLEKLLSYLSSIYNAEQRQITTQLQADSIDLDVGTAIPLGLIITELVSNALKHAFADTQEQEGQVTVELELRTDHYYWLQVSDNGTGLPTNFDVSATDSLGLKLVYGLVEQLHGSIDVHNKIGTTFEITFPA